MFPHKPNNLFCRASCLEDPGQLLIGWVTQVAMDLVDVLDDMAGKKLNAIVNASFENTSSRILVGAVVEDVVRFNIFLGEDRLVRILIWLCVELRVGHCDEGLDDPVFS